MRPSTFATLAILLFTVIWGASYFWMQEAQAASRRHLDGGMLGDSLFLAARFTLGAGFLLLLRRTRQDLRAPGVWPAGGVLGGLLLLGFLCQMGGLRHLPAATSAFLTSLYVVFTALVVRVVGGRRLRPAHVIGAILATAGAAWIDGPPKTHFGWPAWVTVAGAFLFAVHIVATDSITRRVPALGTTATSLLVVAGGSWILAGVGLAREPRWSEGLVPFLGDSQFLWAVGCTGLLATALAIALMNRWQRELPPVRAAVLYALEPIWTAVLAAALGLPLSSWLWLGGGLVVLGNLVAEVRVGARPVPVLERLPGS